MCGRFTLTIDPAELQDEFQGFSFPQEFSPRYNIAPGQPILVIPNVNEKKSDFYKWGLIPSWAKDPVIGNRLINARAETLSEKPSFRSALKYHRCLIIADGFYEWKLQEDGKTRVPHYIYLKSRKPFGFAGLWDEWQAPDGSSIRTTTIITLKANPMINDIHDRMPAILPSHAYAKWLTPQPLQYENIKGLLLPYPAKEMGMHVVSRAVNNPANELPECVVPTR